MLARVFEPYPDELMFSWIGRLADENAMPMPSFGKFYLDIDRKGRESLPIDVREGFPALCRELSIEPDMRDAYLSLSTFGVESMVMSSGQQTKYTNVVFRKPDKLNVAGPSPLQSFKICPECVQKDQETYGQAYIHRSHNVSGVCTCYKHGCRLLEYKGQAGHEKEASMDDFKEAGSSASLEDETAYAQYAHDLLAGGLNMDIDQLREAITAELKDKGYADSTTYEPLTADLEQWERHALLDGMDVVRFVKAKLTKNMGCQIRRVLPIIMFLYPDASEFIRQWNKPEQNIEQYTCKVCGRIYCATPESQRDGWGCPYCEEEVPEETRFKRIVGQMWDGRYEAVDAFQALGTPVGIRHKDCGEVFSVKPSKFLFDGRQCPCTYTVTENVARQNIDSHPGFHLVEFNGASAPVKIRHDKCGHEFTCDYYKFLDFPGCRYCNPPQMTAEIYEDRVKALVGDEYTILEGYRTQHHRIVLKHNKCGHEQSYKPSAFLDGQRCKYCQEEISRGDLNEMLKTYSSGRYEITEYDKNVCTVIDHNTGEKIKIAPLKIQQEIKRPTPSDILPIEYKVDGFEPVTAWDKKYALLCQYKEEKGTANAPKRAVYQDSKIGLWCQRQRKAYHNGKLTREKIGRLEEIGFSWTAKDADDGAEADSNEEWGKMYDLFLKYKDEYGTADVMKEAVYRGVELGRWCQRQRLDRKQSVLTEKRLQNLNEAGFLWGSDDPEWNEMCGLVRQYIIENGSAEIPFTAKYQGKYIGIWCYQQRKALSNGFLSQKKARQLTRAGYAWTGRKTLSWDDMLFLFKAYKEGSGNADMVTNTKYKGISLGAWCQKQRAKYKQGTLPRDKTEKLTQAGFNWDQDLSLKPSDERWEHKRQMLIQYKEEHGNIDIKGDECYRGFRIGVWCENQRRLKRNGKLSQDRVDALETIGFSWDNAHDERWNKFYRLLAQYQQENPYSYIPMNVVYKGEPLGDWCGTQRSLFKTGRLRKDHRELLDEIGFRWEISHNEYDAVKSDKMWEDNYQLLKKYKDIHGSASVPNHTKFENVALGDWCVQQRRDLRNGAMREDRKAKLDQLGFKWDASINRTWNEHYELLKQYKDEYGNTSVPLTFIYHDFKLGSWCSNQRRNYKNGILTDDHVKKLNQVGFVWAPSEKWDEAWEQNYDLYIQYKKEHEGFEPEETDTYHGIALGCWCGNQRQLYKKHKMKQERIAKLEEAGFIWSPKMGHNYKRKGNAAFDEAWNEKYDLYVRYKKEHGGKEPRQRTKYHDVSLGSWCGNQRQIYRNGKMRNERIKKLDEAGFNWNP